MLDGMGAYTSGVSTSGGGLYVPASSSGRISVHSGRVMGMPDSDSRSSSQS